MLNKLNMLQNFELYEIKVLFNETKNKSKSPIMIFSYDIYSIQFDVCLRII